MTEMKRISKQDFEQLLGGIRENRTQETVKPKTQLMKPNKPKTKKKKICKPKPPRKRSRLQIRILLLLRKNGQMTRSDLCKALGHTQYELEYGSWGKQKLYHSRTTVYDNLLKLQKQKIVEKFSKSDGSLGRPKVYWKIIEKEGGERTD